VVGLPIGHSLSPVIHTAWLEAAGIDGRYLALAPSSPAELVELLESGTLIGCNVTAPYKPDAFRWARERGAETGPEALATGSVNLLVLGECPQAWSTDGQGLIAAIRARVPDHDFSRGPTVILGAGGAASAAVHALRSEGSTDIRVVNRTRERAAALADRLGPGVSAWPLDAVAGALEGAHMLINAASHVDSPNLGGMARDAVVMDMSYRPLTTPLLAAAEAGGLITVDGLAMLIGQARPSFSALFGCEVPDVDVRSRCLKVLEGYG
jgi:shikimate dehydrogenase